ncbi:hypothetical protein IMG5_046220, partial [Ichthyophthirius multifiliis]
ILNDQQHRLMNWLSKLSNIIQVYMSPTEVESSDRRSIFWLAGSNGIGKSLFIRMLHDIIRVHAHFNIWYLSANYGLKDQFGDQVTYNLNNKALSYLDESAVNFLVVDEVQVGVGLFSDDQLLQLSQSSGGGSKQSISLQMKYGHNIVLRKCCWLIFSNVQIETFVTQMQQIRLGQNINSLLLRTNYLDVWEYSDRLIEWQKQQLVDIQRNYNNTLVIDIKEFLFLNIDIHLQLEGQKYDQYCSNAVKVNKISKQLFNKLTNYSSRRMEFLSLTVQQYKLIQESQNINVAKLQIKQATQFLLDTTVTGYSTQFNEFINTNYHYEGEAQIAPISDERIDAIKKMNQSRIPQVYQRLQEIRMT